MTVGDYTEEFYGLPIVEYRHDDEIDRSDCVYRLMQEYEADESQRELLEGFLAKVDAKRLRALVIGPWAEASTGTPPDGFFEVLIERRLPNLQALFVGDMTFEDAEISWINQTDYAPLLAAYPNLEVLRIRGGEELTLPTLKLPLLRELAVETGGLPNAVVEAIAASDLPALKKLELWLGSDGYGFDGDLATYKELLAKIKPERLDYLGLRNSEISDDLAAFVASQPWLGRLHTLDLSMGTISDRGANALLASPHIAGLKSLDLRHHYISDGVVAKLKKLPLELVIDARENDDEPYVQVSE